MAKEVQEYLQEVVDAIRWIHNAFRIGFGEGKFIFAAVSQDVQTSEYYAVSTIYDSICDLNCKIKYAFEQTLLYSFPETLAEHQPFSMPSEQETIAMYHVENRVFRISILWDLLVQLCNVIYHTGLDVDKIHYNRYFRKYGQGENAIQICKEILAYLSEKDDLSVDSNPLRCDSPVDCRSIPARQGRHMENHHVVYFFMRKYRWR